MKESGVGCPISSGCDALVARDLGEHGGVGAAQHQQPLVVALDHEPAVAADGLADVDRHRRRHRELRPPLEGLEHVVGLVPGRARVPQPQPRDAVGVDVLGCALELGEDRELVARGLGVAMRHLEQHGAIALHDEWAVRHNGPFYAGRAAPTDSGHRSHADDARHGEGPLDVGAPVAPPQAAAAEAGRLEGELPARAVGKGDDDGDDGLRAHRRVQLPAEPRGVGVRTLTCPQRRDQGRMRVAFAGAVRLGRGEAVAVQRLRPIAARRPRSPGSAHPRATSTPRPAPRGRAGRRSRG